MSKVLNAVNTWDLRFRNDAMWKWLYLDLGGARRNSCLQKWIMGIRHFERNHQRRQRDSEDHQIESFQPVDDVWEDSQQPMNLSQKTMDHQFFPMNFNPQTESEQVQYSHIFTMMLVACYQLLSFLGLQKSLLVLSRESMGTGEWDYY